MPNSFFVQSLTNSSIRVVESNKGIPTSLWGYFALMDIKAIKNMTAWLVKSGGMLRSAEDHVRNVLFYTTSINHLQPVRYLMGQMQSISTIFVISYTHNTTFETPLQINITPGNNLKVLDSFGSQSESPDNECFRTNNK